jgi:hypothetical protein
MKTTLIALASIFLFSFSCEGDKKENQQLNDLEKEAVELASEAGLKAEDFKGKIDELLTLEMAAEVSGLPASDAEKEHSKFSSLESLKYEWKSGRTKKVAINGQSINVPANNCIELSWVKNTTLEQFKHDYHNPTADELKRAEVAMNNKANELNAEGKASKDQTDKANSIAKASISKFKVEEVPNLGTYSVFVNSGIMGVSSRDLKVFYKGLSFTIGVDLSDNAADNDKKAIQTAKMIINQKLQ